MSDANRAAAGRADGTPVDLAAYDAIVYDLDGTLVYLPIDWAAVAADVLDVYAEHAIKPPTDELWGLLGAAEGCGIGDPVEEAIARYERAGARESTRLPLGDRLAAQTDDDDDGDDGNTTGPAVGVCSLNCETACRIAVETHDLDAAVVEEAIVGRDTVETHKPEPESLLAAIERLDSEPDHALFVGDSERDAVTAERAGVDYAWVSELVDG